MNEWGGGDINDLLNECRAIQKRLDGQCKQRRRPCEHIARTFAKLR